MGFSFGPSYSSCLLFQFFWETMLKDGYVDWSKRMSYSIFGILPKSTIQIT